MSTENFSAIPRVDAHDKVRGRAIYGADRILPRMAHAVLATATIAKGTVRSIDAKAVRAMQGVRLVLTEADVNVAEPAGFLLSGSGYAFQSLQPLESKVISYRGQAVALVVADTLEEAVAGARALEVDYERAAFSVSVDDAAKADIVAQEGSPLPQEMFGDKVAGDPDTAIAAAPVSVYASYRFDSQHQNPMELIATVAEWRGDRLTVHEGTQNAGAIRHGLAKQLGIPPESVEVVSPHAGGGFGQKNSQQSQTLLAAVAARMLGRPVKLVVTREQVFHNASFRPAARHRVSLGADRDGRILGAIHEVDQQTSRHDLFASAVAETTSRLYGIENFRGSERLIRTDVQTPGYMRAPFEHAGTFAFETAVDELAYKLEMDPIAVRVVNDATKDPLTGRPFSSRHLVECLTIGAERFGWEDRRMLPGSMVASNGDLVGWGVGCGAYKAATAPAMARIHARADGAVRVEVSGHEMGQGMRTAIASVLARRLDVSPERIEIVIGDTKGVSPQLTAGSWGTATAIPAVEAVAEALMEALRPLAQDGAMLPPADVLRRAGRKDITVEARHKAPGQPDAVYGRLASGLPAAAGPAYPDFVAMSYIAHFVEVRVERSTRRVRVPRVVSVADCGRVVSPTTAASQVRGGVVGGIGAALLEISEIDTRFGGFLNPDLADYVMPVNADIGEIDVSFIDKPDPFLNTTGVKGLGEVAMTGVAAAVANAIHHATGKRHYALPIRLDQMIS